MRCKSHLWVDEGWGRPRADGTRTVDIEPHTQHSCERDLSELRHRAGDGKLTPFEAIGAVLGINRQRASQNLKSALHKVGKRMHELGICEVGCPYPHPP